MSSRSSYLSGLEPDPHISASGLQYSGLTSKYRAHVPERDVFAPCEGAVLPMLLGSKFEPKAKGFCGYQVDTRGSKTYAIKEGSYEKLCSPSDVNIEIEQAHHEEKGSTKLEVATKISAACPDEPSDLVPTTGSGNEDCSCGPLMLTFNGFCEHRSLSIHSLSYDDEDDEDDEDDDDDEKDIDEYGEAINEKDVEQDDNEQDIGNKDNVGKDAEEKNNHEWDIEPSGACVRDEGNQFTEQVSPVELLESGLRNDLADIVSFTDEPLAPSHQSLSLCDLLPPKSPEPDGGLDDDTIRPFKALDPIVELMSFSPFPILYYTNAPVLDPNRQLCAEHSRHSRTFGLGGGGLCRTNRGWITTTRNRRPDTRSKRYRGTRMSFYDIVRPNPSAPTIHHPAWNQPLSYLLGLLTISSSFGDGYSRFLAFRKGVYILQRHVVIHLSGNLPHDSAHLHLTGNHRYRTNASGSSGSGSPSEQGNFNSSSGDECWDEYSSGEYGAGDIFGYPQNYSVVDSDVLSEEYNYQLSPGRHATEYYQTLNSNQFGDSQALPVHQPLLLGPLQVPLRARPPYHPAPLPPPANYGDALGPTGLTTHTHFPSVDFGYPNMSPSGLFHASPIEDVAIQSMYFGPPVGHTVVPSWASASSPQPLPIDVGARPWQGHFASARSTSNSSPTHSIGAAMVASASADPGSSDSAKRTIAPRKKGGPKPSNKTCPDCGQKFDRPFLLADHMHVHTGTKNHTCPGCGNSYSTKSNMGRHHRKGKCEG